MMDKNYQPQEAEANIYRLWEDGGCFTPVIDPAKKPFTILLPPPNANDPLHVGHVLYVVEDILCRFHRMRGEPTLFLPGTDHAGIETQFVFEKNLAKEGKSRFDFDRQTLYAMINDFVEKNRGIAKEQLKRLGFSLDWTRERYTLDPEILKTVFDTFQKLHQDGLIYRGERMVNYCTHCGTAFSELEVRHQDRQDALYYLDYGTIQIATTRPETIFADAAVAVNPKDERYQKLIGQRAILPILNKELPIIADELVDPEFGTGALKITPAHDPTDFEIGQNHQLELLQVIDPNGRLISTPEKYLGLTVTEAREKVVADLTALGKLIKTAPLPHAVGVCYRCGTVLEPLPMPQWFVKIKPLAEKALAAVKTGDLKITPKRFEKTYEHWLENIHDWNISRQIVWGPRIPAWYCLDCNPGIVISFVDREGKPVSGSYAALRPDHPFDEIAQGLQRLSAPSNASYELSPNPCPRCGGASILQETDTFDTWFSSGQWPLTTLGYPDSPDFNYFYPTAVLDTMWDILFFWVSRMVMLGIYRTGKVPFAVAHMHCRVVDEKGQKMSKSKDNTINPMDLVGKYGADALRLALIFGAAPGSDIRLGEGKVQEMRDFANKLWNAARFVSQPRRQEEAPENANETQPHPDDQWILEELAKTIRDTSHYLEKFRFDLAIEGLYQFFWHTFCDKYIELTKNRRAAAQKTLNQVLTTTLKLLHPFAPFVTEAIWQKLHEAEEVMGKLDQVLSTAPWPEVD